MWRTGRHQTRNLYYDNNFVAVVIGCEEEAAMHAHWICDVLNNQGAPMSIFKKRPKVGDAVLYKLSSYDVDAIEAARAERNAAIPGSFSRANQVHAGDIYHATVVRTFDSDDDTTTAVGNNINLSVQLDGDDTYWATSRREGDIDGTYSID